MNILIIGGAGFIGSHTAKSILKDKPRDQVIILDNYLTSGHPSLIEITNHPRCKVVQGSINDNALLETIFASYNISTIIETVDLVNPNDAISLFVNGTNTLLTVMNQHKEQIERFLYISSDEVYGDSVSSEGTLKNSSEEDQLKPTSLLATAQAAGDLLVRGYCHEYNLPVLVIRPANVYGAYMRADRLLSQLIISAIRNENILIYGTGTHTRDWLYIDDFVNFITKCIYGKLPENQNIFNLSTEIPRTIIEVTEIILHLLNKPNELITFDKDKTPKTQRKVIDADKAVAMFDWRAETDLQTGLKITTNWFLEHYGQNSQTTNHD